MMACHNLRPRARRRGEHPVAELTDSLNEMLAGRTGQISQRIGGIMDTINDMLGGGDKSR